MTALQTLHRQAVRHFTTYGADPDEAHDYATWELATELAHRDENTVTLAEAIDAYLRSPQ